MEEPLDKFITWSSEGCLLWCLVLVTEIWCRSYRDLVLVTGFMYLVKDFVTAKMTGKPKFLFGGEEGTYEDFERKLNGEITKAGLSTEFKKKSFLYKHLTGGVLDNLTKLIFPTKISEKTFNDLLETLKNHYIPNKHLRERVILYARIQDEEEATKDFFEDLKNIASRCKYKDDVLKVILCDKALTGIICPLLRESLFKAGISPSCTAEQYMEYALLFEESIRKEKLAKEKKGNKKNVKLNINNNIERSPSPNPKKPKSDSPAGKFGVSLKKNGDNNNNNKNGNNKSPTKWEPKSPLTPQATFGVTLKSKSSSQVSPKSSPVTNSDAQKENMFPVLKPIINGNANRSNSMSSPKSNSTMNIPEIVEPVKQPKKPALTPEARKILEKHGFVQQKSAHQKDPSWSPSPSPEPKPRKPMPITLEAKMILDKHNQKKEPPKPPPRREPSWSPSPSPEPRDSRSQDNRGRNSVRDAAPKLKRSSSNLNVRDKPTLKDLSPTNTTAPAPKLKRSSSTISISRDPRPDPPKNISSNRALRDALPVLKSVKNCRPEPEPMSNREKFDISNLLPKLRPTGMLKQSPSEILDFIPEILEDTGPRKPTITAETQAILDKYCNKPRNDPPQPPPRRDYSYSPSPEPEPRPDLTRKQLFDKYAKPAGTPPNKSSPYSDFTKSDIFDQFLQARNSPTSGLKAQKSMKVTKAKKDEVPQLTDDDRRKLEEKYGIIKAKPKEAKPEESPKPERKRSPSRAKQSRELFEEMSKSSSSGVGVVKASDRVVQMYNDAQKMKEALIDNSLPNHPERSNGITPTTTTDKPLITIKASPKIAEMYKAQVEKRDKTRCPSPPPEKVTSNITKYAEKKWTSNLDLSNTKKEYDQAYLRQEALKINAKDIKYSAEMDYGDALLKVSEKDSFNYRTIKTDLFPQEANDLLYNKNTEPETKSDLKLPRRSGPHWSPSPSPEPRTPAFSTLERKMTIDKQQKNKEPPKPPPRRVPHWSPSPSPEPIKSIVTTQETKMIIDKQQPKKEPPKPPLRRELSWSRSPSPEPSEPFVTMQDTNMTTDKQNQYQVKSSFECAVDRWAQYKEPPKLPQRREPSWSPSPSPEPSKPLVTTQETKIMINKQQPNKEPPKPPPRQEPSNPVAITLETNIINDKQQQNKEPPIPPPRREPSPEPSKPVAITLETNIIQQQNKDPPIPPPRTEPSGSPNPTTKPVKSFFTNLEAKMIMAKLRQNQEPHKPPPISDDPYWCPSSSPSPEPQPCQPISITLESKMVNAKQQENKQPPKPPPRREKSWSPSPSPEPYQPISVPLEVENVQQEQKEPPTPPIRREPSWSPSPSPEPRDSRDHDIRGRTSARDAAPKLKRSSSNFSIRDTPLFNDVSPTDTAAPAHKIKRSYSSISLSRNPLLEPPQTIRELSYSPSPEREPPPKPPIRREPSWSPSPSPEPRDSRGHDIRGRMSTRDADPKLKRSSSNFSVRVTPLFIDSTPKNTAVPPQKMKRSYSSISISRNPRLEPPQTIRELSYSPSPEREPYQLPPRRETSWSPSPSPEPRDSRSQDNRGRNFARDAAQKLMRNKKSIDELSTKMKRSYSSISISRHPHPEPPHTIRELSYSPSPEPEPRTDLTRTQLFNKYANPEKTPPNKSSSYLDLTKSDIFEHFLQAKNLPISHLKAPKVDKITKQNETPKLTEEDRRKLEERYGIIKGKPRESIPEEAPDPERSQNPGKAKKHKELFEEKMKAAAFGNMKKSASTLDFSSSKKEYEASSMKNNVMAELTDEDRRKLEEKYVIVKGKIKESIPEESPQPEIKRSQSSAKQHRELFESKAAYKPIVKRSWTSALDLSSCKKEYDADYFKQEALKFNPKEVIYKAELDYGDALLKVSEKNSFSIKTLKTDLFPQSDMKSDSTGPTANVKTDSPGPSGIPPKPGTAAAAKPQFDISSFFGGSSYDNFLQSAKSTKGSGK